MRTSPAVLSALLRGAVATAVAVATATAQSGALRCVGVARAGGSVTIEVGCNTDTIDVHDPVSGTTAHYTVPPGRDTPIVIPSVPAGTRLVVRTGCGINCSAIELVVVAPN